MDTEFASWIKVVFGAAVLIVGIILFRDYNSGPVEWRAGQVADKEVIRNYRGNSYFPTLQNSYLPTASSSYYVVVDCGGTKGRVSVNSWNYSEWKVGQACEVADRHGHLLNYTFLDIRRP